MGAPCFLHKGYLSLQITEIEKCREHLLIWEAVGASWISQSSLSPWEHAITHEHKVQPEHWTSQNLHNVHHPKLHARSLPARAAKEKTPKDHPMFFPGWMIGMDLFLSSSLGTLRDQLVALQGQWSTGNAHPDLHLTSARTPPCSELRRLFFSRVTTRESSMMWCPYRCIVYIYIHTYTYIYVYMILFSFSLCVWSFGTWQKQTTLESIA